MKMMEYKKLCLLIQFRAVKGTLIIKSILRRLKVAKFLFIQELEQGQEVFIPNQLSQDHLPLSMRYYDPILQIVDLEISNDKKEYFYSKN